LIVVFLILAALTLALVILSFPAGVYAYYFGHLSESNLSAASPIQGVYMFLGPAVVALPVQTTLGVVFGVLVAIYLAMVLMAAFQGRGLIAAARASFSEGFGALFSNTLFVALIAMGFLVFTDVIFTALTSQAGIPVGSLPGDPFELLSSLTIAPIREEFGFRMIIIGALAVVACVGLPWKTALRALWRPSAVSDAKGNDTATTALLTVGLVISSVTFGLVHILANSGWQIGKLPVTTYAGFVLGYLYIRYGFHVAVLAHWSVDFFSSVFSYLALSAPSGSWVSNLGLILDDTLSIDLLGLFGIASVALVIYTGARRYLKWKASRSASNLESSTPFPAEPPLETQ
jgi:hypothetical protein